MVQLNHTSCCRTKVLGITTVNIDARKLAVLTMNIVSKSASCTQPASHQRMQDDFVANLDIADR